MKEIIELWKTVGIIMIGWILPVLLLVVLFIKFIEFLFP